MTKFKSLDLASAGLHCIADRAGTGAGESRFAVLFPRSVQRLESGSREGVARGVEPFVQVVAARRRRMRAKLLEVPTQLVQRLGPERRQQLIPNDLLGTL